MSCDAAKAHFLLVYQHALFDTQMTGQDPRVEILAKQLPSIKCATSKNESGLFEQIKLCTEKNPSQCRHLIREYKDYCQGNEVKKIVSLVSEQMALDEQAFLKRKQEKQLKEKIFFSNMPFS